MSGRSAPADGYGFGAKANYRYAVWGALRDIVVDHGVQTKDACVAFMPSSEGTEIEVVEGFGFLRENMHVIDRNPAIVANLTRRYPGINTYGVDAGRAAQRMVDSGVVLDAINLDLCGPATDATQRLVAEVIRPLRPYSGALAVTLLRGREGKGNANWWRAVRGWSRHGSTDAALAHMAAANISDTAFKASDAARLVAVLLPVISVVSVAIRRCAIYRSTAGSQTMMWAVLDVGALERPMRALRESWVELAMLAASMVDELRERGRGPALRSKAREYRAGLRSVRSAWAEFSRTNESCLILEAPDFDGVGPNWFQQMGSDIDRARSMVDEFTAMVA